MPDCWPGRAPFVALVAATMLVAGCGGKRAPQAAPATQPPPALIALLPDPDTGITGKIRVSNEFGALPVVTPRGSTLVRADGAPGAVTEMNEADVTRIFGAALAALPPPPKHFTLYFKLESDTLTAAPTFRRGTGRVHAALHGAPAADGPGGCGACDHGLVPGPLPSVVSRASRRLDVRSLPPIGARAATGSPRRHRRRRRTQPGH